jgi:hypothetical protein
MAPQTPLEDALILPSPGRVHHVLRRCPSTSGSEHAEPQEVEMLWRVGIGTDGQPVAGGDATASKFGGEIEADGIGVDLATAPSAFLFASGSTIR